MNPRRLTYGIVLVAIATSYAGYAQESPVAHATRVLDLLDAGKFEDVAAEFNAKMAAAMPVSRLRDMWTTVSRQAGARTSIIRQRVVTQATSNVTVVNVCQFEKTALAVMVSFDPENKIAGMNITPVTPPAEPSAPRASTRFTEDLVTVGAGEWGDLAWGLAERGIAVLRYEKRTRQHGAQLAAENRNFTVREETTEDAVLAVKLLRSRKEFSPKPARSGRRDAMTGLVSRRALPEAMMLLKKVDGPSVDTTRRR